MREAIGGQAVIAEGKPSDPLRRLFQSWEGLLERLPVGVYVCDAEGRLAHYNTRARELWGITADGPVATHYCGSSKAFEADGQPLTVDRSPIARVLATAKPEKDREVIVEHADGRRLHLLANADPLFGEDESLVGAVCCIQDISELRAARDALRARQGWSRSIVENSPVGVFQVDAKGRIQDFNRAATELWGRTPQIGKDLWCGALKLWTPQGEVLPHDRSPMALALAERRQIAGAEVLFERPDGERCAMLAYPTPLFDAAGGPVGAIGIIIDITERKRSEDLQKTLVDELNHRVKNTLATVQSLAAHSFHDEGDAAVMRRAFEARLMALSAAHNQLAERRWEAADLRDLVASVVIAPYGRELVAAEGPGVQLSTRASVTFAMILHELATNAAKYGALSTPEGRVDVRWSIEGEALVLDWRESGGPSATQPERRGFGLRFIRGAAERELGGKVDFDFTSAGMLCRIAAPINAIA